MVRGVASIVLAAIVGVSAFAGGRPAFAQCYPGLACPTQEEQQPPIGGGGTAGGESSSRSRAQGVEYHFVGPVNPPDDWLALRTLPTAKAGERIMKMPAGTLFKVIEKRGEWWFLQLQNGQTGWAHNTWIRCCKYLNE
jgi:hypothetical protein